MNNYYQLAILDLGDFQHNILPSVRRKFAFFSMKNKVSVPLFQPGMPCISLPSSLPTEYPQSSLYSGRLVRCLYSSSSTVTPSNTEPAKSVRNSSGYFLLAACRAVGQLPEISTALRSFLFLYALVSLWYSSGILVGFS